MEGAIREVEVLRWMMPSDAVSGGTCVTCEVMDGIGTSSAVCVWSIVVPWYGAGDAVNPAGPMGKVTAARLTTSN